MTSRTTTWRRSRGIGGATPKGTPDYQAVALGELVACDIPEFVRRRLVEDLVDWAATRERDRWARISRGRKDPGSVGERRFRQRCRTVAARESGCWAARSQPLYGLARWVLWAYHEHLTWTERREAWAEVRCLVAECEAEARPVSARCFSNEMRRRLRRLERVLGLCRERHNLPVREFSEPEEIWLSERLKNASEILRLLREAVGAETYEKALGGDADAISAIREKLGVKEDM